MQNGVNGIIEFSLGRVDNVDVLGIRLPSSPGPSEARNVGIQSTIESTDIYAILDADDEMLPTKLEECSAPFKDERIGVVYANYFNINENTGAKILEVKEPYDVSRLHHHCIVHSGALISKKFLEQAKDETGYYDRNLRTAEDYELWIRLSKLCKFYHIPEALTNALVHQQNSTNTTTEQLRKANLDYLVKKHTHA